VIGISADDEASHKSFAANHKLPFILLSDKDHKIARIYGINKSLGIIPGRVTFVIDKAGVIRDIVYGGPMTRPLIESKINAILGQ